MTSKVDYTLLNDLLDTVVIRLASLGVEDILNILAVDDNITGIKVFDSLLENTLDKVNYYEPLFLKQWVYFTSYNDYDFVDNFDMYIAGTVNRHGLQIIPRVINSVTDIHNGTTRGIHYEAPMLFDHQFSGTMIFNTICTYPVRKSFDGSKYSNDSAIYFIGPLARPKQTRMKDLLTCNVCEHIISLNENLQHPNLPIETFQGLQTYYSNLKSKNDVDYENSHGYAGIYK